MFIVFCRSLFVPLFLFLLATVLSVLLRFTDSDYLPLISSNSSWYHQSFLKYKFYSLWFGRISGVMIMVFASSAVDRGFESRSNQTNEYNIIICCSFHRHVTLRNKSKHYLAQDQKQCVHTERHVYHGSGSTQCVHMERHVYHVTVGLVSYCSTIKILLSVLF